MFQLDSKYEAVIRDIIQEEQIRDNSEDNAVPLIFL
jgi:hypothetical protein